MPELSDSLPCLRGADELWRRCAVQRRMVSWCPIWIWIIQAKPLKDNEPSSPKPASLPGWLTQASQRQLLRWRLSGQRVCDYPRMKGSPLAGWYPRRVRQPPRCRRAELMFWKTHPGQLYKLATFFAPAKEESDYVGQFHQGLRSGEGCRAQLLPMGRCKLVYHSVIWTKDMHLQRGRKVHWSCQIAWWEHIYVNEGWLDFVGDRNWWL